MTLGLNDLRDRSHALAREKGFWGDNEVTLLNAVFGEKLMLIVTEVAEVMEAYREQGLAAGGIQWYREDGKPEGIGPELADVLIRIFDLCGALGIDIEAVLEEKHAFNTGRPYKHGKVC